MYGKIMENSARIDNLEKQVDELSSMLQPGEGKSSSEKKKNKKSSASGSGSGSKSSGHPSSDKKKRFGDPF